VFQGVSENFKNMVSKQIDATINGLLTRIQDEEEKLKKLVQEYEEIRRFKELQQVLDNKSKCEGEKERIVVLDEHLEKQIEMDKSVLESVNRSLSESKKISENDMQGSMTFMKNQETQLEEERKNLEGLKKKELQKLYDHNEENISKHQEKLRKYADDLDTAVQNTATTIYDHPHDYWWYLRHWWIEYINTTTNTDVTSVIKEAINQENQSITTENQSYDARCKSINQTYDEIFEHIQKKLKSVQDFSNASLPERQKNL